MQQFFEIDIIQTLILKTVWHAVKRPKIASALTHLDMPSSPSAFSAKKRQSNYFQKYWSYFPIWRHSKGPISHNNNIVVCFNFCLNAIFVLNFTFPQRNGKRAHVYITNTTSTLPGADNLETANSAECNRLCDYGVHQFNTVGQLLQWLHWLPDPFQTRFKLLVLIFKVLYYSRPEYLRDCLLPYIPTCTSPLILRDCATWLAATQSRLQFIG